MKVVLAVLFSVMMLVAAVCLAGSYPDDSIKPIQAMKLDTQAKMDAPVLYRVSR